MAAFYQRFRQPGVEAGFQRHPAVRQQLPAGGVRRRLGVLPMQADSDRHLQVPLGLHVPAHDAEAHEGRGAAGDEARGEGVVRALARRQIVGMAWLQDEAGAAVVQGYASAGDDDA